MRYLVIPGLLLVRGPLWGKASTADQKSRSSARRQRKRTRAIDRASREPARRRETKHQVPGEPSPRGAATAARYVCQLRAAGLGRPVRAQDHHPANRRHAWGTPIGAIIAAVYAIKAFGKQSEINAEQTRVLELQATELRESN